MANRNSTDAANDFWGRASRSLPAAESRPSTDWWVERDPIWRVSPELLGILNPDGYFERSNPAWRVLLGWSEAEVRATHFVDFLHPEDRAKSAAAFDAIKRGTPALHFENRYRRKDGGYAWLSWIAVPSGTHCHCSARDISAEKEQALALVERTAERDRLWQLSTDVMLVARFDGTMTAVNPAWTALLVLVTDVGLPGGMNGRQVADAARGVRPDLKVLFITGYAENAVIGHGRLDPGMQVLSKPFALTELAARIKHMVAGP